MHTQWYLCENEQGDLENGPKQGVLTHPLAAL